MCAWYGFRPYVPKYKRLANARKHMDRLRKKGVTIRPVETSGRRIATSFWGKAWCDHMESFHDYANRLPRGRTYVRNGSVCHLDIGPGTVDAFVAGSETYAVTVRIKALAARKWKKIKKSCAGKIGTLVELLQGKISDHVMTVVSDQKEGLFPGPREISYACNCPDWAGMCKHVAAVFYGIGSRLDDHPDLLFTLRGVNAEEMIDAGETFALTGGAPSNASDGIAADSLEEIFGIEFSEETPSPEIDDVAAMAAFRKTVRCHPRLQAEEAIVEAAFELGLDERLDEMEEAFWTLFERAVERGVLSFDGDDVRQGRKSLGDYELDEFVPVLSIAACEKEPTPRPDLARKCGALLGFTRIRRKALAHIESAIPLAIRSGCLRKVGKGYIRKV